ncbi:MAG: CRTAC1 family protein [Microthrixaceae bacterium]
MPAAEFGTMSAGAAVGDYDQDGLVDLFLTRSGKPNLLFRAQPDGTFADVSTESGLATDFVRDSDGSAAAAWADIDGDRDLDLFVGGFGQQPDQLFVNRGDGTFTEEAESLGIAGVTPADLPQATAGAAFADWDRDGDLDLALADWITPEYDRVAPLMGPGKPSLCDVDVLATTKDRSRAAASRLMENDGAGHFRDVTAALGAELDAVAGFTPVFADLDDDGWVDFLLAGDFCSSRVYRNREGAEFIDETAGAAVLGDENAMGSVVEDLTGDGHLDWFVTSIAAGPNGVGCRRELVLVGCSGNRLYRGGGDMTLSDETDAFGVRESGWAWGAAGEDLDNDGQRELLTVSGQNFGAPEGASPGTAGLGPSQPALDHFADGEVRVWGAGPKHPFSDGSSSVGIEDGREFKAVVPFDQDGDGDLDLLITKTGTSPGFYRNQTANQGHWLQLRLRDSTTLNTQAIGARIRIPNDAGMPGWVGEVRAGSGYQSSGPGTLHVGLGHRTEVDAVEVRWPDADEYETYAISSVDQVVDIVRQPPVQ